MKKIIINSILVSSLILTNSCSSIMASSGKRINVGEEFSEIKRDVIKKDFLPVVQKINNKFIVKLESNSLFEIEKSKINITEKEINLLWSIPTFFLTAISSGFIFIAPNFKLFSKATFTENALLLIGFALPFGFLIADMMYADSKKEQLKEPTNERKKDYVNETNVLKNTLVILRQNNKTYNSVSDSNGVAIFEISDNSDNELEITAKTNDGTIYTKKVNFK